MTQPSLLEKFKTDPSIVKLMSEGNLERVSRMATAMGTVSRSPELRKYGKELWESSQRRGG